MIERRAETAARLGAEAARAVAERVVAGFALPAASTVAGYWPLDGELDPRPCLRRLAAAGHAVALPRMQGSNRPLVFHAWQPDAPLIQGPFKVMQPAADLPEVRPAVLLVPLLAFDRAGRRLGYGKGFYDMTLAGLRAANPATLAIGVAFAVQEVDEVPADASDERLDAVVTEAATHRIGAGAGTRADASGRRA